MARMVKPKPLAPRRRITGGFRLLSSGESSRHGEASREEAVDEPPGDCTGGGHGSSAGRQPHVRDTRAGLSLGNTV